VTSVSEASRPKSRTPASRKAPAIACRADVAAEMQATAMNRLADEVNKRQP
jgi:hypothetical protein